jgi:hypothetical protein
VSLFFWLRLTFLIPSWSGERFPLLFSTIHYGPKPTAPFGAPIWFGRCFQVFLGDLRQCVSLSLMLGGAKSAYHGCLSYQSIRKASSELSQLTICKHFWHEKFVMGIPRSQRLLQKRWIIGK